MYGVTTRQRNLLNRTPHESDSSILYTYFHEGRWLCTDKAPENLGDGYVQVEVQAVYDDAETMLKSQRENGYHSWKRTI